MVCFQKAAKRTCVEHPPNVCRNRRLGRPRGFSKETSEPLLPQVSPKFKQLQKRTWSTPTPPPGAKLEASFGQHICQDQLLAFSKCFFRDTFLSSILRGFIFVYVSLRCLLDTSQPCFLMSFRHLVGDKILAKAVFGVHRKTT